MPGFGDTIVIGLIALLLFGPKKLPVLARQLGKLMADFRRASNEFRSQMEEELRISEQADRQKEIAALEAANANKIAPPAEPHVPPPAPNFAETTEPEAGIPPALEESPVTDAAQEPLAETPSSATEPSAPETTAPATEIASPPIATSGSLTMMPPETGLPVGRSPHPTSSETEPPSESQIETETLHG